MPPRKTSKPAPVAAPAPAPIVERSEAKGSGTIARPKPITRQITQEMIAKRAYEIYASRGYAAGDEVADWLEAERQLKAGL